MVLGRLDTCVTHLTPQLEMAHEDWNRLLPILKSTKVRNENSAQRGSFGPDIPADVPPKTSVRPSKILENQAFRNGHPTRTSMKKLRSEKLRADFSFPIKTAFHSFRLSMRVIFLEKRTSFRDFLKALETTTAMKRRKIVPQ